MLANQRFGRSVHAVNVERCSNVPRISPQQHRRRSRIPYPIAIFSLPSAESCVKPVPNLSRSHNRNVIRSERVQRKTERFHSPTPADRPTRHLTDGMNATVSPSSERQCDHVAGQSVQRVLHFRLHRAPLQLPLRTIERCSVVPEIETNMPFGLAHRTAVQQRAATRR